MARRASVAASVLEVSREGAVVTLTLAGGGAAGPCLTPELHAALAAAAAEIDLDDAVRVVVLRSSGKAFCRSPRVVEPVAVDGVAALAALRVPVVALLQGDALDVGLELALACDLRIAAPTARLGVAEVVAGRLPRHGATQRLPRLVGASRALSMLLLGELLPARRALELGVVNQLVAARALRAAGAKLAHDLAARAPIAQRFAKEALRAAPDLPLLEGLRLEGDLYVLLQTTADRDAGIASFRTRRQPRYEGR